MAATIAAVWILVLAGTIQLSCSRATETSSCQNENMVFSVRNMTESYIHMRIDDNSDTCNISVDVSVCNTSNKDTDIVEHSVMTNKVSTVVDNYMGRLHGNNITVAINSSCDVCTDTFYMPELKPTVSKFIPHESSYNGVVIDDLSNDYNCDFSINGIVSSYKIYVHSKDSIRSIGPCSDDQIKLSWCESSAQNEENVGLKVKGVENETTVCIFCEVEDCNHHASKVMLFNFEIVKCSERAELKDGKCNCKEPYKGDGVSCSGGAEMITTPPILYIVILAAVVLITAE
jgi:hypothetical protein